MKKFTYIGVFAVCAVLALSGCDHITRHMIMSTIIDGEPSLPPPEEICKDYHEKEVAGASTDPVANVAKKEPVGSVHLPYKEKKCDDCHDKVKKGGLNLPINKLCFVCHNDFVKGAYVHGPVASSDCLVCHEPHESSFPKLLKSPVEKLCGKCHSEKRTAAAAHDKFVELKLPCVECHNPHFGNTQYFLR